MTCFICGAGKLRSAVTEVEGTVKGEKYTVETPSLTCDACGHVAMEGVDAQEFMRRLTDAYKRKHGLL